MVIIIMGVSGSGKSTISRKLADALRWTFIDADSFHPPLNVEKMSHGIPLTDEDRMPWLLALRQAIVGWLQNDQNAVLACSALTAAHRRILVTDEKRIRLVYLKSTPQLIRDRLARRRHHFMPKELLQSQFEILEEPVEIEALTVDAADPPDGIIQQIRTGLKL